MCLDCHVIAILIVKQVIERYFSYSYFTMESGTSQEKSNSAQKLKQVKVDNWGIFFLQRLQQMFHDGKYVDLKLKFPTDGIVIQVQIYYTFVH